MVFNRQLSKRQKIGENSIKRYVKLKSIIRVHALNTLIFLCLINKLMMIFYLGISLNNQ